jgi:transcriptional regulator with XRE-family HTH domain
LPEKKAISGMLTFLALSPKHSTLNVVKSLNGLSRINTHYAYPSAEKIPLLAEALGVSLDELYGMPTQKPQEKIRNPKLWKKFEKLDMLAEPEKRTVIRMIDGLVAQRQ